MEKLKAIIIVGLPASGKTTLSKTFGFDVYDDAEPACLDKIDAEKSFVINSPLFCLDDSLKFVESEISKRFPNHIKEIIHFENNPEQCKYNAKYRDRKVNGMITYLSKNYNPPLGSIPVYCKKMRGKGLGRDRFRNKPNRRNDI